MVGNSQQFSSFREIFRGHLAGADQEELLEIQARLSELTKDVILRQNYLQRMG